MGTSVFPSASAAPGGSNTDIQYNDHGVLDGDNGLTWDSATGQFALGVSSVVGVGSVQVLQAADATTTPEFPAWYLVSGDGTGCQISGLVTDGTLAVPTNTSGEIPLTISGLVYNGNVAAPAYETIAEIQFSQDGATSSNGSPGKLVLRTVNAAGSNGSALTLRADRTAEFTGSLQMSNGQALRTTTTTAHTGLIQAYDVDGAAYKTFVTLTNANVPTCNISQPAGAILAFIPPTADPHVAGALWNNAGTLTISAG